MLLYGQLCHADGGDETHLARCIRSAYYLARRAEGTARERGKSDGAFFGILLAFSDGVREASAFCRVHFWSGALLMRASVRAQAEGSISERRALCIVYIVTE